MGLVSGTNNVVYHDQQASLVQYSDTVNQRITKLHSKLEAFFFLSGKGAYRKWQHSRNSR